MMTSSTMVFSASGVSAATTWPTIDTPNAMKTLRLWAMRNGHKRRSHPPADGGAGPGVGRSEGRSAAGMEVDLHGADEGVESLDHGGALGAGVVEHRVELPHHGPFRFLERGRSRLGDFETHAAAIARDVDPLHPAARLEPIEQPGERGPGHRRLLGQPTGTLGGR